MIPIEVLTVALIHLVADNRGCDAEELAKKYTEEANMWFHPKRKEIINSVQIEQKAPAMELARKIYKEYPTKTGGVKGVRRIAKSPTKDIESIMFLILKHGGDAVTQAFKEYTENNTWLADLRVAIKRVADIIDNNRFEGEESEVIKEDFWQ